MNTPLTSDLISCSFNNWYKNLNEFTLPSVLISIPEEVTEFILSDGIHDPPKFDSFFEYVDEAITRFRKKVFVRVNWMSLDDAFYVLPRSDGFCTSYEEIMELLQTSEKFVECIERNPISFGVAEKDSSWEGVSPVLILQPYIDIPEEDEFRLFVFDKICIGISSRNEKGKSKMSKLGDIIRDIMSVTFKALPMSCYVCDVIINDKKEWKIIDVSPFGGLTDPSPFTYDQLVKAAEEKKVLAKAGKREKRCSGFPIELQEGQSIVELLELLGDK
ncbi:Cell division cycle protein 123 like protein [Aduncisulcus paluster]|uniref:Cell division cycle protein 123 like protein n=1 Tax=Aduncisulcus paluster TaxID=2918883 RepID=A0ABQ5K6N7_9EUKA|nr:Cell division cycle protein 123 like protein [Aduncisulcus paluster]